MLCVRNAIYVTRVQVVGALAWLSAFKADGESVVRAPTLNIPENQTACGIKGRWPWPRCLRTCVEELNDARLRPIYVAAG